MSSQKENMIDEITQEGEEATKESTKMVNIENVIEETSEASVEAFEKATKEASKKLQ